MSCNELNLCTSSPFRLLHALPPCSAVGHVRSRTHFCRVLLFALGLACLAAWLVLGSVAFLAMALPGANPELPLATAPYREGHAGDRFALRDARVSLSASWSAAEASSADVDNVASLEGAGAALARGTAIARQIVAAVLTYRGGSRSSPSPWSTTAPLLHPPLYPSMEPPPATPGLNLLTAMLPVGFFHSSRCPPWEVALLMAVDDFPRSLGAAYAAAVGAARLQHLWPILAWLGLSPIIAVGLESVASTRRRGLRTLLCTAVRLGTGVAGLSVCHTRGR